MLTRFLSTGLLAFGLTGQTAPPDEPASAAPATVVVSVSSAAVSGSGLVRSDSRALGGISVWFGAGSDVIDVTLHGARADGSTDSRAAIQAAIDASASAVSHPTVAFPAGTYRIGGTLVVQPNVELLGYSGGQSVIQAMDNTFAGLAVTHDTRIRGLTVRGANPSGTNRNCRTSVNGINGGNSSGNLIEDNIIEAWGCMGIESGEGSSSGTISHNVIRGNGDDGIHLARGSGGYTVDQNYIHDNQRNGIDINSDGNLVRGNDVQHNGLSCAVPRTVSDCTGITLWQTGRGLSVSNNVIEGNAVGGNVEDGILVSNEDGAVSSHNLISNNTVVDNRIGIHIRNTSSAGSSSDNEVIGNTVTRSQEWGIFVDSASDGRYSANRVEESRAYDGITIQQQFATSPDNNIVSGNVVSTSGGYGINALAGNHNSLTGNFVFQNSRGSVSSVSPNIALSNNVDGPPPEPLPDPPLSSACPKYPSTYGTFRLGVDIGADGDYAVWTRMLPFSDLANSYYLQVDDSCPELVGGVAGLSGAWYWIGSEYSFAGGPRTNVAIRLTPGTHVLTLIGRQANVALDALLLTTDLGCVPDSANANCTPSAS
jgi:parallel beta-helix repeat protein